LSLRDTSLKLRRPECSPADRTQESTLARPQPEEIHALIAAAINAGDLDAFLELHEEHAATIVSPEGRRVSGREAIRAAMQPIFALRPSARIEVVGKLQADGLALALTHARLSVVAGDGGERVEVSGRGTIVSRRQSDGTWRIVLDNPDEPRVTRAPARSATRSIAFADEFRAQVRGPQADPWVLAVIATWSGDGSC
jgi:uncharacterized protein (TIGR02246 family)